VSVPAGTFVARLKLASAGSARSEPPSDAVHAMLTPHTCHLVDCGSHACAGHFSSTMIPVIGPAVTQFPALSQTLWLLVEAFAVSVPAGTFVARLKLASAGSARSEPPSDAVHGMLTSVACHVGDVGVQARSGGVKSSDFQLSVKAAPSTSKSHDSPVAVQAPMGLF